MASLRRPPTATAPTRRTPASRQPPPPLSTSLSSSSHSSLLSPPLPRSNTQRDTGEVRQKRESTDGNIQVVVRCRCLSPSERARNVQIVAATKATRGTEVQLTNPDPTLPSSSYLTSSSHPSFGAPPTAQTKTWDFGDRVPLDGAQEPRGTVYGPDADQGMLYNDVAKPILQQVLQGYNCTIFAYGQTGTGKTYTMEGDLSPYHGTFHPDAGIVPRTLYSLFDRLAESKCEYSVRCSFIELYNEELRDLNAGESVELGASSVSSAASTPEPGAMPSRAGAGATGGGGGGGGGAAAAPRTLRIYEETKNGSTGVTIQGLEETFIQNAEEGLRVLRRGSDRRQIAATNCNERSSRSHSIFTIHVHVKDASKEGQDVLKVGKLNLVDLAGSENVGRSGAVQGRAREAGMINASLLALGRVINQLVDKSENSKKQHIAYRESKLTRLLQDSLGGRTKTTIIATISPVSYEETASTLTYAHQAKSIQNRPEVNQRVSRNVLLNQFATEIERLKADLNAARGSEGVFVSKETWDELESGRQSFDETKRKLEITESQLQTTRDQFEQNFRLLSTREEKLKRVVEELGGVREELERTKGDLEGTKKGLAEQEVLRDAFETSREGWKDEAKGALDDVEGLRAKLHRKTDVERANLAMIADARTAIAVRTKQIDKRTTQLRRAQEEFVARLANQLDEFSNRQQLHLASTSTLVTSHLSTFAAQIASLASTTTTADDQATSFRELVESTCAELFASVRERGENVEREQTARAEELGKEMRRHAVEVSAALEELVSPVRSLQAECAQDLLADKETLLALRERDSATLATENARLKRIITTLRTSLATEQSSLASEEAAILSQLQQQLSAASARRLRSLQATNEAVEVEIEGVRTAQREEGERRGEAYGELGGRNERVARRVGETARTCEEAADERKESLAATIRDVTSIAEESFLAAQIARQEQLDSLAAAASLVRGAGLGFRNDASTSKRVIDQSLHALVQATGDSAVAWHSSAALSEREAVETARDATAKVDDYSTLTTRCLSSIEQQADDLADKLQQDLQSRVRHDVSTGLTPQQRDRPVDRLLPQIDLDSDRPTVLDRLLALRAEELAATAAAAAAAALALEQEGQGIEVVVDELAAPPPAPALVVAVPSSSGGRQSLVSAGASSSAAPNPLKGEAMRRVKPAVLGERDLNNGARRTVVRRVTKGGVQAGAGGASK